MTTFSICFAPNKIVKHKRNTRAKLAAVDLCVFVYFYQDPDLEGYKKMSLNSMEIFEVTGVISTFVGGLCRYSIGTVQIQALHFADLGCHLKGHFNEKYQ